MKQTLQLFTDLKSTTKKKEKEAILLNSFAEHTSIPFMEMMFKIGFDDNINTFLATTPNFTPKDKLFRGEPTENNYACVRDNIEQVYEKLSNFIRLTKSEWEDFFILVHQHVTEDEFKMISELMTKSLTIGMSAKSYNKILLDKVDSLHVYECMKVTELQDSNIDYDNALVGIKYDGVNSSYVQGDIISRNGRPIYLKHMENILKDVKTHVLMGELYTGTRQSSSGLVNSAMKSGYESTRPVHELKLAVFDMITIGEYNNGYSERPFEDRIAQAKQMVEKINNPMVKIVEQIEVTSHAQIIDLYEKSLSAGEEGIIINNKNSPYEAKRSKFRARIKEIYPAEMRIVGFNPHSKRDDWIGSLQLESDCGNVKVNTGSGLTEDMMANYFKNFDKHNGSIIEIKYNKVIPNSTKDGYTLFLPVIVKDRFDKNYTDILSENRKKMVSPE